MNKLYFLIGFMGSGKSYLSREVSAQLGYRHIEMDDEIIKAAGMSINAIFEKYGEAYFREMESTVIDQIIQNANQSHTPTLVSTGGGAPCFFDNMERMKETGWTVFIYPELNALVQRLELQKEDRPLIRDRSESEIRRYVVSSLKKRLPFYQKANLIFAPVSGSKILDAEFLKRIILSAG